MDDLIDGLIKLMNSDNQITGPINLGNPGEFTINELAQQVVEITNSSSNFVFKPLPSDDPIQRCPDISVAKETLNWQPEIDLYTGLHKTIQYFEKTLIKTS